MADLTASSANPTLLFDDTSVGGVNWRIRLDPDDELHVERWASVLGTWGNRLALTASHATAYGALLIHGSEPTLTFTDSTGGDDDFRLRVNGDILYIESDSGSGFRGRMSISAAEAVAIVPLVVENADPSLTLRDSDASAADFRLRANGDILHFESDSGSGFGSGLEMDADGYTYATRGLSAGHDAAGAGPSHAICWKRGNGNLIADEVTAGYFTYTLADGSNPPEWYSKTVGVIVMLSSSSGDGATFQVSDWRSSSASGYFSVQVIYGTLAGIGDQVKVTFDTSYYGVGAEWTVIAFYTP